MSSGGPLLSTSIGSKKHVIFTSVILGDNEREESELKFARYFKRELYNLYKNKRYCT